MNLSTTPCPHSFTQHTFSSSAPFPMDTISFTVLLMAISQISASFIPISGQQHKATHVIKTGKKSLLVSNGNKVNHSNCSAANGVLRRNRKGKDVFFSRGTSLLPFHMLVATHTHTQLQPYNDAQVVYRQKFSHFDFL